MPTSPLFEALGTADSFNTTAAYAVSTWTHNSSAAGVNRAVVVPVAGAQTGQAYGDQTTRTVTYGGVPMVSLGFQVYGVGDIGYVELFGLLNQPTGPQTVIATVGNGASVARSQIANSFSYTGVKNFGVLVGNVGTTGTALSVAEAAAVDELVAGVFTCASTITGYSQTQRYAGVVANTGTRRLTYGDAPGAASVAFAATQGSSGAWAALAARLLPAPPRGQGAGAYTWAATTAGKSQPKGAGSGAYGWSTTAVGKRKPTANGGGTYKWSGAAGGTRQSRGQGVGAFGWAGTATGEAGKPHGAASGAYSWSSADGVGHEQPKAFSSGTFGWRYVPAAPPPSVPAHRVAIAPATDRGALVPDTDRFVAVPSAPRRAIVTLPASRSTITL